MLSTKQRLLRVRRVVCVFGALITFAGGTGRAMAAEDVMAWNARILDVLAVSGQIGPVLTRSLAMAHAAVHDALNAIDPRFERYELAGETVAWASAEAAIASASHAVLVGVIPSFGTAAQQATAMAAANAALAASLATIPDGAAKTSGIAAGQSAAAAILALRSNDGALNNPVYVPLTSPGYWQPTPNPNPPDPVAGGPGFLPALLPGSGDMTPFVLNTGEQFRPDGPPSLPSEAYARDYNQVERIGAQFSAVRTPEQSQIARFWYEGSPFGWNRIARIVAEGRVLDLWDQARLFALVNFAMADGFIAGWNTRYFYNFWRPVTAIRAGDTDSNAATIADPQWNTFLNTPAIPDYPSTHSVLGAAAAEVLARYFDDDTIAFTVTSGAPFGGITRSFTSFSAAARENGNSRVYAGIHFRTAVRDGLWLGGKIGSFTFRRSLRPLKH
jgi:hypothetical protein